MRQAESAVIRNIFYFILSIRLNLHQPLRTRKHSEILRQIACDIGKRILYLADKLKHRHKCTVGHSATIDTKSSIDCSKHISSVHNCSKADIAHIRKMILTHAGFLVLAHMAFRLSKTIHFLAKCFDDHQTAKMLLQEDTDKSILFLHLLVQLF